ncbi:ATP-dependent nuclease [Anaeromyxobacter dehalogenans]|uniref:ATP-dependent endonuclease of the OLD family-like protein n=1 Tax=Anaeromyxobacter dehalogenans (strain 2CP-C) TaxID=290397 RepID=Q2IEH8_ANADE|nr:AAA family ATPase [Anaeromyxobacter dehalogenans]ABC82992.1 ATP-dependent endonuclease of the OLD family-like protein [Anaeromyxobacter dehalogenans 2CP-C]
MYLSSLQLTRFRSFRDGTVYFDETLTVLAGENNSGKTNVLEALRLLTPPSDGRVVRWPEPRDITRGFESFSIRGTYSALDDRQRGSFLTCLRGPTSDSASLGLQYAEVPGKRRGERSRVVGPLDAPEIEPKARELVRHVHLPALRDASRELASSAPGRIEHLLRRTATDEQREALVAKARQALELLKADPVIGAAEAQVQEGVRALTAGVHPHEAHLGFADPTLTDLARDLRLRLGLAGMPAADLYESGLGYANVLFLALVVVELANTADADLTLFLVEEPEAHLHPQLQAVMLEYLRDKAEESQRRARSPGEYAGRIQVIVSTHSPHLTSAVGSKKVVILRTQAGPDVSPEVAPAGAAGRGGEAASASSFSAAVSLAQIRLREDEREKIDRYLDVTRSAMLFSRRVLLVEGISEALLIPAFGKVLYRGKSTELARLTASTIVPISGVDFEPYVRLLLTPDPGSGKRVADLVVVLTDEDPASETAKQEIDLEGAGGVQRRRALKEVSESLEAADRLSVQLSPITFEAALLGNPPSVQMEQVLRDSFLALRPRSALLWDRDVASSPPGHRGACLVRRLKDSGIGKGDYAQEIARRITPQVPVPSSVEAVLSALVTL